MSLIELLIIVWTFSAGIWLIILASIKKEKEIYKYVPDSIQPVLPEIKYVNRDKYCEHLSRTWVEMWWGYDWVSMWVCDDCWMWFDRWSELPIVLQYNTLEKYAQPMFLLQDGSMSRMNERWKNPAHKNRTINRSRYQDFR